MGDMEAVKEALREVLGAISEADGREMVGKRKPKAVALQVDVGPTGEGSPEHESEEMDLIRSLEEMHGEKDEDMSPRGRY